MYNQNYKVEIPQFPDREVSIAEYGAKSGDLQIETGRHNAEAINRAICEVDRKSTRLNSSHSRKTRMPSSA